MSERRGWSSQKVLVEDTPDAVRVITLNDPERRNAIDVEMMDALVAAVDGAATDRGVRALVIAGAGPSFCAGAAIDSLHTALDAVQPKTSEQAWSPELLDPVGAVRHGAAPTGPPIISVLREVGKPSFAAVHGHAYGLGLGLALACDFRFVGAGARFNSSFVRHALVPGDGSAWLLPRIVGSSRALWLHLSGETIDAEEALRIGLADWVVPDGELRAATQQAAASLARGPAFAIQLIKQLVSHSSDQDLREHLALAARAQQLARASEDHAEGVRAFVEKRTPRFADIDIDVN